MNATIWEVMTIKNAPTVGINWHYDEKECTWYPYKHDDEPHDEPQTERE